MMDVGWVPDERDPSWWCWVSPGRVQWFVFEPTHAGRRDWVGGGGTHPPPLPTEAGWRAGC